ncbi:MAG TPA: GNAT family N-acetyltransferase [Tepidisphaeraceae bacterium]
MKQRYVLRPPIQDAVLPFGQQVDLQLNGEVVASARWHAPESTDGVFQIADIRVVPAHQRQGHGSALLKKCYAEAAELYAALNIKPRRVWILIEQKKHVIARAFLSRHGFQHVSTMSAAFRGQDGMIYQRSFD